VHANPKTHTTEKQEVLQEFVGHEGRITRVAWGALNRTILSAGEDGTVRLWDVEARARNAARVLFVCRRARPAAVLHLHASLRTCHARRLTRPCRLGLRLRRRASSWRRAESTRSR
jgi:WD40 repeat protein